MMLMIETIKSWHFQLFYILKFTIKNRAPVAMCSEVMSIK